MANVTVNGTNYTGINEVRLPVTGGGGSEQSFVLPPSGTKSITANGNGIDVSGYAAANVNVPVGITPSGTKNITANGSGIDVASYAAVNVNVPVGITPSGTKNITANGSGIDVASYAAVNVNVPVGITPSGTKNITANGNYDVTNYANAQVSVSGSTPALEQKSVTAPASGTTDVIPSSGYDGLSKVTVSATPTETKSITANGTYTPTSGKHFSQVTVNVSNTTPSTQEKTVTPTTAGVTVTPDSGKLLSKVTVSGDTDLVAGNIKSGVNIFGVTGSYTGSGANLQTKTVTPSTSQQNVTPDSGYDGLSRVTINAISTEAKSVTPSASAQTITPSSGKYLSSVSVAGDADLVAENIKSGVNIFGVTGTYTGSGGGSGGGSGDGGTTSIEPTTDTWQHNQYVTLTVDIDEEGNLSIRQSSGAGTTTNLRICYPQGSSTAITKIPNIPTTPGNYTLPITATWQGDSNNHTLNYTVISSGSGGGSIETVHLFGGFNEPSSAAVGDLWVYPMPGTIRAGDNPIYASSTMAATKNSTSMSSTGISITVYDAGTYRFKCAGARTSTSGTFTVQLYKGTSPISGAVMTWNSRQGTLVADVQCSANDTINVYARSGSTSNYTIVGQLIACVDMSEG